MPIFLTKNLFSAQLDFPPPRTAKKAPKPTWACFHCCSSALATVFQLPQPWTPRCPFFLRKNFFRPSLIFHRQEQPKRRPKPPGLASIATAVLWQQYFNCHNRGPPCAHFFYQKNICSTRLAFWMLRTAKKPPKGTRVCFRSCSSALATLIPLLTPQPRC